MANKDLLLPDGGAGSKQGSSALYNIGTTPNTRTAVSQKVRILSSGYGQTTRLQMGVVSSFNPSESRTIEPLRGIGFGDKIAELVPSVTEPMSIAFERALLYLSNLWQATGYRSGVDGPVRSLRHHRWPFDIEQQMVFSGIADFDMSDAGGSEAETGVDTQPFPRATDELAPRSAASALEALSPTSSLAAESSPAHTILITFFEACWFQDWNTTYSRDAGMIMESGTAMCTDVHDGETVYSEFLSTGNDPTLGEGNSRRFGYINEVE